MSTPRLNHALVLEAPHQVGDGAGGFATSWTVLGTLWAEIKVGGGREATQSGAPVARVTCTITVRGAPWGNPDRPAAGQRFRDGTRVFTIQAVAERDPAGRYLTCYANEETVT